MRSRIGGETRTRSMGNTGTNEHRQKPILSLIAFSLDNTGDLQKPAPSRWNYTHSKLVAQRIWRRRLGESWRNCKAVPCQQDEPLDQHKLRGPLGILHQSAENCCCFPSAFPISSKFLLWPALTWNHRGKRIFGITASLAKSHSTNYFRGRTPETSN